MEDLNLKPVAAVSVLTILICINSCLFELLKDKFGSKRNEIK